MLAEALLKEGMATSAEGRRFLEFLAAESRKGVMRPREKGNGDAD